MTNQAPTPNDQLTALCWQPDHSSFVIRHSSFRRILGALLISSSLAAAAETPNITQNGIQSAFRVLQREYIRSGDLTFDELNRAALDGLLQRLQFGAELIPRTKEGLQAKSGGVVAALLRPDIAYLRPGMLAKAEVAESGQKIAEFAKSGAAHLILDLREPGPPGDFDDAATFLGFFVPQGEALFKTRQMTDAATETLRAENAPLWTKNVLVLVDADTGNIGETIAAVLQKRGQALLIGTATRGAAVRYEITPLDANWSLRYARAEVLLADDSSIFQKGLRPDLEVKMDLEVKREFFIPDTKQSPADAIREPLRPRFNEAALVAGTHPELDAYVRRSAGQPLPEDTAAPRDAVLQRAVDLIVARQQLQPLPSKKKK